VTAADEALAELRRRILGGDLAAGTKLHQTDLATSLGMSRIPVRDAIRSLTSEGLVIQEPHRSAVVAPLSMDDLAELYELRLSVEPHASALAVPNLGAADILAMRGLLAAMDQAADNPVWLDANDDFHAHLYRRSGRPRMIALLDQARAQTRRYTGLRLERGRPDLDIEHRLILAAAERRDPSAIRALVQAHLYSAYSIVRGQLHGRDRDDFGNYPASLEGGASGAGMG
jgi:DNA-binding GntR family transcriptional regulator